MNRSSYFVQACFLLLSAGLAVPARAESSIASSASDSASDSVGSLSGSVSQSSDSSSGDKKVAAGDYRLIEMAAVAGQPGLLRLHLQAAADDRREFFLTLPRQAAENGRLAEGQVVTAHARPYGLELVAATDRKAFFLLVDDAWHRELASHPVTL